MSAERVVVAPTARKRKRACGWRTVPPSTVGGGSAAHHPSPRLPPPIQGSLASSSTVGPATIDVSSSSPPGWTLLSLARRFRWRAASRAEALAAEARLLAYANVPGGVRCHDVPCGGTSEHYMRTLSSNDGGGRAREARGGADADEGGSGATPVVLLHGYGAGAALFYRNLASLSLRGPVHAADWLGAGLSGRPAWRTRWRGWADPSVDPRGDGDAPSRGEAEAFFLDALGAWQEEMTRRDPRMERVVLVGHSLGAYLSTLYALRHPERVEKRAPVGAGGQVAPVASPRERFHRLPSPVDCRRLYPPAPPTAGSSLSALPESRQPRPPRCTQTTSNAA